MGSHSEDIRKHVRTYLMVFGALLVLTVVTVAVSRLDLGVALGVTVALLVATVKGSLVACFFMHLISEKQLIFITLILCVFFFIVLLIGPSLLYEGPINGTQYQSILE